MIAAAVSARVLLHGLDVGLEPLASTGGVAELKLAAGEQEQQRRQRLGLSGALEALGTTRKDLGRDGGDLGLRPLEGRQGRVAGELCGTTKRVALEPGRDQLQGGHGPGGVVRGDRQLGREDRGRQFSQRLALPLGDGHLQLAGLPGADGPGGQEGPGAPCPQQGLRARRRGIQEDFRGTRRGQDRRAEDLIDLTCRSMVLLPKSLQLDQIGDHARGDQVVRTLLNPLLGQDQCATHRGGIRRDDRRTGSQRFAQGAIAQVGQLARGGQFCDLHRLLEPIQRQDWQAGARFNPGLGRGGLRLGRGGLLGLERRSADDADGPRSGRPGVGGFGRNRKRIRDSRFEIRDSRNIRAGALQSRVGEVRRPIQDPRFTSPECRSSPVR